MNEKLRLPSSCTRLDGTECAALEGGCFIRLSAWCYAMAHMVIPHQGYQRYQTGLTEEELRAVYLQQEHGDIVKIRFSGYTYADGYVYKMPSRDTGFWKVAGFFYDAGDLFHEIGL